MKASNVTYVLPIRRSSLPRHDDLPAYLAWLVDSLATVIVVDGSPRDVFDAHAAAFPPGITHVGVDPRDDCMNGKVAGVWTAMRMVRTSRTIVADDDVRYDGEALRRVIDGLVDADVVVPQNFFSSRPWHAYVDEGRTVLARITGGDWPGTMALRTAAYVRCGGYDGDVLFENLELVRTIVAGGGSVARLDDVFVARRPPTAAHFLNQRVRQAYDEFARPARLSAQLALLPAMLCAFVIMGPASFLVAFFAIMVCAECGRRRAHGRRVFPVGVTLAAPLWVVERALTSWCALALRLRGGVRYSHGRIRVAAHSVAQLQNTAPIATTRLRPRNAGTSHDGGRRALGVR